MTRNKEPENTGRRPDESPTPPESDGGNSPASELSHASDPLERSRNFLENCIQDPDRAFDLENPDDLLKELSELSQRAEIEGLSERSTEHGEVEDPSVKRRRTA